MNIASQKRLLGSVVAASLVAVLLLLSALPGGIHVQPSLAAPLQAPTLSVNPSSGVPGTESALTGSGYTPGTGTIRWDGVDVEILSIPGTGSFTRPFTIPANASLGAHTITVCWGSPCTTGEFEERASVSFQVESSSPPSLSVNPAGGSAGGQVVLNGSGYTPGGYEGTIRWDSVDVATLFIPDGGVFTTSFTIPANAWSGTHTITVCAGAPCFTGEFEQRADTSFQVLAAPTPVPEARSLELNGQDAYVEIPFAQELNFLDAITIEAWVKRASVSDCQTIIGNGWKGSYWLGLCDDGHIRFYHGSGQQVTGAAPIPADKWTHIAVTYDGQTRRYYINGDLDLESTDNSGALAPADQLPLYIGADRDGGYYFKGLIDEVRIWNVVRSQDQIKETLFQPLDGDYPELLAGWHFDGDLIDAIKHHHGTFFGAGIFSTDGFPLIPPSFFCTAPIVVDFESLPDGTSTTPGMWLTTQLESLGVRFPLAVLVTKCNPPGVSCDSARSGDKVAKTQDFELSRSPFVAEFTAPQRQVCLYVTYDGDFVPPADVMTTLTAYDESGSPVDSQTASFNSAQEWRLVKVQTSTDEIQRIVLTGGMTDAGATDNLLLVDDLAFAGQAPPPPPEDSEPPRVEILDTTVLGERVDAQIRVEEDRWLHTVQWKWVHNDGDEESAVICSVNAPNPCPATVFEDHVDVGLNPGLDGPYTLTFRACDAAGNCGEASIRIIYERPEPPPEIRRFWVEVNQGVQNRLFEVYGPGHPSQAISDIPIVPGKDMVVRYYLLADGGDRQDFSATLRLYVEREDGSSFTRKIRPNAGISSISVPQDPGDDVARDRLLLQMRADLSRTLNYVIPGSYLDEAEFIELKLTTTSGLLTGGTQLTLHRPVLLGLNIIRVTSSRTGFTDTQTIDTQIISMTNYLEAAFPVRDVLILSRRDYEWGGPSIFDDIFRDVCSSLLFDVSWLFALDDVPIRFPPSVDPTFITTLGVAQNLRACGGVAYLGDPDDDTYRTGGTALTTPFGDTAAHEIGHTIGFVHVSNNHGEARGGDWEDWTRWGYSHGQISPSTGLRGNFGIIPEPPSPSNNGQWGLTLVDPCPTSSLSERLPSCTLPTLPNDTQYPHELMSYGTYTGTLGSLATSRNRWISSLTYGRVYNAIRYGRLEPPVDPQTALLENSIQSASEERVEALLIGGVILEDGMIELLPLLRKPLPPSMVDDNQDGPYTLELQDANGNILLTYAFDATKVADGNGPTDFIREVVPYVEGMKGLVIKRDGQVLLEKEASPNAPQVRITTPNGGEDWQSGTQIIRWEAGDADDDPVSFLVQYSPDDGRSWQGIALVRPGDPLEASIDVGELIPGHKAIIRVTASDGFNTTVDQSDDFFSVGTGSKIYLPVILHEFDPGTGN